MTFFKFWAEPVILSSDESNKQTSKSDTSRNSVVPAAKLLAVTSLRAILDYVALSHMTNHWTVQHYDKTISRKVIPW